MLLTDVAKIHLCYSDSPDTTSIPGQLWVNYRIKLYVPQMVPAIRSTVGFSSTGEHIHAAVPVTTSGTAVRTDGWLSAVNGLLLSGADAASSYVTTLPHLAQVGFKLIQQLHPNTGNVADIMNTIMQYSKDGGSSWIAFGNATTSDRDWETI